MAIKVMGHWSVFNWLSAKRSVFPTMTNWERRSFIMASYGLGDEGRHWRKHNEGTFNDFESLAKTWVSESKNKTGGNSWRLPI